MCEKNEILEKKMALADRLLKKNILLIYADISSSVFVATDSLSSDEVAKLIIGEGFELADSPDAGYFATAFMKKNGYWCVVFARLAEEKYSACLP